jgi:hypothetical protein
MTAILDRIVKLYGLLLQLYPSAFRSEFEQEMLLDFSALATDASRMGKLSFLRVCFHELVDFPINLLRIHLRYGRTPGAQPVTIGLRGAAGFGVGFAFTTTAAGWVSRLIYSVFDLIMSRLPERVQAAFQDGFLAFTPLGIYFILTSVLFGLLLAMFLGNRTKFYRYVLAGALCWMIPEIISFIVVGSLGEAYYHPKNLAPILGYSICILAGVLLSAAYLIAENDRREALRYLAAGTIVYPLGTYLFIKLLFDVWHEITPWFSLALMIFLVTLTVGLLVLTMPARRHLYFGVAAGGIGYFLLNRALFYVASHLPGFSLALNMGIVPDVFAIPLYYMAIYKAIFGALFGLIVGAMFGLHKKSGSYITRATA